jgi:hypothetical protein
VVSTGERFHRRNPIDRQNRSTLRDGCDQADGKWEKRLPLILVLADSHCRLRCRTGFAFSDAYIMQSCVRGGNYCRDPWKPRIGSETGSCVPSTSMKYSASSEERTDSLMGYMSGGVCTPQLMKLRRIHNAVVVRLSSLEAALAAAYRYHAFDTNQ